jgi:OOP family OmpA-OmpF porin
MKEAMMKASIKLTAISLAAGLLAGCAGNTPEVNNKNLFCATTGGIVGGAATGATVSGPGAVGGAIAGGMLALLLCQDGDAAPAPTPVVETAECPVTPPPGALLDENGCAFDSDNDGVFDGVDMCADTPEGVAVDLVGCPLDEDKDAVPDYADKCLGTPLGTIVNPDGCPLEGEKVLSLTGVNFETNKAILTDDAKAILDDAVASLKSVEKQVQLRVEGHTDSRGSEAYNMALSQRRAQSVVDYLVSQGVDADSLIPVGMGESQPVASNATSAGQALNRRVDFIVSK